MNKEQVAGKAEELKGKVKEKVGDATNNPNTKQEGLNDQVKGKVQQGVGNVKEAVKDAAQDR